MTDGIPAGWQRRLTRPHYGSAVHLLQCRMWFQRKEIMVLGQNIHWLFILVKLWPIILLYSTQFHNSECQFCVEVRHKSRAKKIQFIMNLKIMMSKSALIRDVSSVTLTSLSMSTTRVTRNSHLDFSSPDGPSSPRQQKLGGRFVVRVNRVSASLWLVKRQKAQRPTFVDTDCRRYGTAVFNT